MMVRNTKVVFGTIGARLTASRVPWGFVSAAWFVTGISAALFRAFKVKDAPDTTVLGFLVFAFVGFLVPIISNLELPGGTKIQFTEFKAGVSTLEQNYALAVTDIARMMNSLVVAQTRVATIFRRGGWDRALAHSFAKQTVEDAMSAFTAWLVPQPQSHAPRGAGRSREHVRVTLWSWNEEEQVLEFVAGTVTAEQEVVLRKVVLRVSDRDYIGDAWTNARIVNQATTPDGWRARSSGTVDDIAYPNPVRFGGVMFVPVFDDGRRAGLIQVDRGNAVRFEQNAEVVASALAEFVSAVFGHPLVQWGRAT